MPNIPDNTDITPEKFEQLVHGYLSDLGKDLKSFEAVHNSNVQAHDGTYQIDVKATFEALGCDFVVLVECKRHRSAIKREVIQVLHDKIRSTGAHKGILFSTSKFQEGAREYALKHGIALVRVIEGRYTYFTKSAGEQQYNPPPWAKIPEYVGEYEYAKNAFYNLQPRYLEELATFLFTP